MKKSVVLLLPTLFSIAISTTANAFPWQFNSQRTNSQPSQNISQNSYNFMAAFRPPNRSQPRYTVGGATRGDSCAIDKESTSALTALVPAADQSLTIQERPTMFAYVPPMSEAKPATLVVKDETENYYHSQKLTIPSEGGVVRLPLNENAPPLEVGQSYTWSLLIQCDGDLRPEDPYIGATISRVEGNTPSMAQDKLVSYYANSFLWYDTLNSAFELSQSGKNTYWSQLLSNIGMDVSDRK